MYNLNIEALSIFLEIVVGFSKTVKGSVKLPYVSVVSVSESTEVALFGYDFHVNSVFGKKLPIAVKVVSQNPSG